MSNHPIDNLMSTAMKGIREMVDVNTIVGEPVETPDGSVIVPISRVAFGFAAGGSEFGKKPEESEAMFGGGSGGGVSIAPMAFLVVNQSQIKLLPIHTSSTALEKIIDLIPGMIDKVNNKVQKIKAQRSAKNKPITVEAAFDEEE